MHKKSPSSLPQIRNIPALPGFPERGIWDIPALLSFIFAGCLVALLNLVGWGIYRGGLPHFSDLGII